MLANYHTHTTRCHHAAGRDEDYVIRAIEQGLSVLGFSDHTPYFYDGDYRSPAKMSIDELGEYCGSVLSLREKYKDKIDIKLGLETEYFPKFFDRLIEEYRKYPLDYIILGQHIIGNESTKDSIEVFKPTSERSVLTKYTDQCIAALETGRFSYFAHPDVIKYEPASAEDEEFMNFEFERIIKAAMRTQTPVEINLCGLRFGRNYPNPRFWHIAGKLGADVIIGCDAHAPEHVADPKELAMTQEIVRKNGLKLIEKLTLKDPLF